MENAQPTPLEECALASGLVSQDQLDEARKSVRWSDGDEPAANAPPNDQQLANRLVDLGVINAWQAGQLLEGRTRFNLGPYKIVDSIGQGGMGQVFKAEHGLLGRVVAVKVLPRAKTTPEAIANFTNEIRALARLDHPNLVRALDAGHDANVYFLVTEYVPGCDLRKLVRRDGALGMEEAASIISQVARGLAHAHARAIVHRDVKPGNVLVTPDGDAKLSDLGLAGPLEGDLEKDPRFGKIVGTADYLSPDHIRAPWEPTPAWDIYSLGCTLYYAVTGKVPFPGGSTSDKARAHCELRPLDPRRLNPKLSNEFVDVLADMMAKDPAERVPTAEDVMRRLEPWAMKRPVLAKPPDTTKPLPGLQAVVEGAMGEAAARPPVASPTPPAPPPPQPPPPVRPTAVEPPRPPVLRPTRQEPPRSTRPDVFDAEAEESSSQELQTADAPPPLAAPPRALPPPLPPRTEPVWKQWWIPLLILLAIPVTGMTAVMVFWLIRLVMQR